MALHFFFYLFVVTLFTFDQAETYFLSDTILYVRTLTKYFFLALSLEIFFDTVVFFNITFFAPENLLFAAYCSWYPVVCLRCFFHLTVNPFFTGTILNKLVIPTHAYLFLESPPTNPVFHLHCDKNILPLFSQIGVYILSYSIHRKFRLHPLKT